MYFQFLNLDLDSDSWIILNFLEFLIQGLKQIIDVNNSNLLHTIEDRNLVQGANVPVIMAAFGKLEESHYPWVRGLREGVSNNQPDFESQLREVGITGNNLRLKASILNEQGRRVESVAPKNFLYLWYF